MTPGDLVIQHETNLTLIFIKFTHWGGFEGQFIFPDGTIRTLGTWGVKKI
jgi:hypothetical protein